MLIISLNILVRIMARVIIKEDFEKARKELASVGIILYNRKHRKGGYVCRASKELRERLRSWVNIERYESND